MVLITFLMNLAVLAILGGFYFWIDYSSLDLAVGFLLGTTAFLVAARLNKGEWP